jgi:predicted phage-related endonuclease
MKMSTNEIVTKIEELNEWEQLLEEAKEQVESIKDMLKEVMMRNNTEELDVAGKYIIRWTSVTSNKFDSATFKKELPEVYKAYLKQTLSRRFSISA